MSTKIIKWETEASSLAEDVSLDRFVFRNNTVNQFLDAKFGYHTFIIAGKGMGKTLLLHYKRHLCESQVEGYTFLPSIIHRPIDYPENIRFTIEKDILNFLENYSSCKLFWSLALKLYILSGVKKSSSDINNSLTPTIANKYKCLIDSIFDGYPKTIGCIVNELLDLNYSQLSDAMNLFSNRISTIFGTINIPVVAFLDQLDQSMNDNHKSIWINMQIALLDAAWDINRVNTHIKIYLSIRKEAYSFINRSPNANSIQASVVQIKYEKEELEELLNHLVNYYEGKKDIYVYFGKNIRTVNNLTTNNKENIFDFMFRYSIGRPRDFVQMFSDISLLPKNDGNKNMKRDDIKMSICHTAGDKIINDLFEEQKVLLECFDKREKLDDFLKLLKKNVYTYDEVKSICSEYNGFSCDFKCTECIGEHHPFCDLYNMGLLGTIDKEVTKPIQSFKTPYEAPTFGLKKSDFYLIHPALRMCIEHLKIKEYRLVKGILVGHKTLWNPIYEEYYKIDKALEQLEDNVIKMKLESYVTEYIKQNSMIEISEDLSEGLPTQQKKIVDGVKDFLTGKKNFEINPIKIFITYASDGNDKTHEQDVDGLREELCRSGFNANHYKSLVVTEHDLDKLMKREIMTSDKVIIILNEAYKRKADNCEGGVWREYQIIRDDLEKNDSKYIFACFHAYNQEIMQPVDLGNKWVIQNIKKRAGFNELVSHISGTSMYDSEVSSNVVEVIKKDIPPFFED